MARKRNVRQFSRLIATLCAAAIIVLGIAGWAWWQHVYNDPQRAYWSMLANSLSTSSVTREITAAGQVNTQKQTTRLSLGGQEVAQALTTIQQPSATGTDTAVTETLGTVSNDYARYLRIDTQQRDKNGQPLNFSNVLGVWGKSDNAPAGAQPTAQFLSGSILSVVPFAPLNAQQRQLVLQTMRDKKVYAIDYSKVTRRSVNGRPAFVYPVSVGASAYVSMLKVLAQQLGMKQLDKIDPAAYAQSAPEQLEVTVDKLSHQLLTINFGGLRQEAYSGYGLLSAVPVPSQTIPIVELQQRLQSIQ